MHLLKCILLLALLPVHVWAQDDDLALRQAITAFFQATTDENYEQVLDGMYPELFELIPRDLMLQSMNSLHGDSTTQFRFSDLEIGSARKRITYQGIQYVVMQYSYVLTATIAPPDATHPEEDPWSSMELSMAIIAGDQPVTSDPDARTLRVRLPREMICILDPRYAGWKFIENKPGTEKFLTQFFPPKVTKALRYKG